MLEPFEDKDARRARFSPTRTSFPGGEIKGCHLRQVDMQNRRFFAEKAGFTG